MRTRGLPLCFPTLLFAGAAVFLIVLYGCADKEVVKPTYWEDPQHIPCETCIPFDGYYTLRDVDINSLPGNPLWMPLPANTISGKIFSGYLMLNTFSELTVYRSGEVYNSQEFTTLPFAYTEFYNYFIISDSTMKVGPEKEPACFFPHLGPNIHRIDTIIWDRCRYIRQ